MSLYITFFTLIILFEVTRALAHIGILFHITLLYLPSFWCCYRGLTSLWCYAKSLIMFLASLQGIGAFINIDLKKFYSTLDIVSLVLFSFTI